MSQRPPAPRLDRIVSSRGFSIVELLTAVSIAGVVGAALISIIRGQTAYYAGQESALIARQNLRAVHDLMGAEIRLATGTDLLVARPDSVSVRSDLSRAVVCDSIGSDQAAVFVYDTVSAANLPAAFRGHALSTPADSTWTYSDGSALPVLETGGTPRAICVAAGAPAVAPDARFRRLAGFQAAFTVAPPPGSLLRAYGRLTFHFSGGAGRLSLRRNSQELATPFGSGAFAYVMWDGTLDAAPSTSRFRDVVAVQVAGTSLGDPALVSGARSFSYEIALRNGTRSP